MPQGPSKEGNAEEYCGLIKSTGAIGKTEKKMRRKGGKNTSQRDSEGKRKTKG